MVTIVIELVLFILFLSTSLLVLSHIKNKDYKKLILISTLVLYVMCFTGSLFVSQFYSSELSYNTEKWGQFGDYLGGVLNPILSFITILLLLWNIYTQNQESKKK